MVERLRRCCEMHDFSGAHARSQLAEKELKRRTLLDILDYVHLAPGVFTGGGALAALVRLVEANLFRSMPSRGSRLAPSVASSASAQVSSTQPAPHLSAERGGGAAASAGGDDRGGDGGEAGGVWGPAPKFNRFRAPLLLPPCGREHKVGCYTDCRLCVHVAPPVLCSRVNWHMATVSSESLRHS